MITLASDFGSPYPAAMRGVLLSRTDARLVDIAHDLPRQDVRAGAFWLREVLPWFPPAVHLVVVDPGVGTDRAAIAVRAGEHVLIGPDNGILIPPARSLCERQGQESEGFEVCAIDPGEPASSTFHGRDVFAPAAAAVHEQGIDAVANRPFKSWTDLRFPAAHTGADGAQGEVLVIDGFGNVITNIPGELLNGVFGGTISINGDPIPAVKSYAHAQPGDRIATVGSHGNLELAVTQGRGDEAYDLTPGDSVEVILRDEDAMARR